MVWNHILYDFYSFKSVSVFYTPEYMPWWMTHVNLRRMWIWLLQEASHRWQWSSFIIWCDLVQLSFMIVWNSYTRGSFLFIGVGLVHFFPYPFTFHLSLSLCLKYLSYKTISNCFWKSDVTVSFNCIEAIDDESGDWCSWINIHHTFYCLYVTPVLCLFLSSTFFCLLWL